MRALLCLWVKTLGSFSIARACMRVGPARGWSTQPLGPGYVAELRRAARRDARVPAATRGCPPRREGARRDARVPGFYSLVHSGFCFSMNAFMPIFWSLVEKVE